MPTCVAQNEWVDVQYQGDTNAVALVVLGGDQDLTGQVPEAFLSKGQGYLRQLEEVNAVLVDAVARTVRVEYGAWLSGDPTVGLWDLQIKVNGLTYPKPGRLTVEVRPTNDV